jgi:galactokinase
MTSGITISERFHAKFGSKCRVYRAPGRINLIGEHTDYNDGFVMPAAIEFYCWVAIAPRSDGKLLIHSEEFPDEVELDLSTQPSPQPAHTWSDYPIGVAMHLQRAGFHLRGANLLIHSDIPMGAGLSSSAAVEVATALALAETSRHSIDRTQLARICQRAENDFVGMKCGIISLYGRRRHALLLDCRSLQFELVPLPGAVRLVICNTSVKHQLAGSEYNRRRADCEEAVSSLKKALPAIRALRDVSKDQLERHRSLLSETAFRRALHVVSENQRVLDGAAALCAGDLPLFGKFMAASHQSLRDLYEVSCAELDLMVEISSRQKGVYGARMTGGGFGGATINLVKASHAQKFAADVAAAYQKATGLVPHTCICVPTDGASLIMPRGSQD